jgi:hypothetical protein
MVGSIRCTAFTDEDACRARGDVVQEGDLIAVVE